MTAGSKNPNYLVVEGFEDMYSIRGLMTAHILWPEGGAESAPVFIHRGGGAEEILKPAFLTSILKSSSIQKLGIVIDTDNHAESRYKRLFDTCHA